MHIDKTVTTEIKVIGLQEINY